MNESDLELLVSQFLEGIRRAFREVGKKGAADHPKVMDYLNRAIAEADKIRREELPKPDHVGELKELERKIKEHAQRAWVPGAESPDKAKILRNIHTSPVTMELVAKQSHTLREQGIAAMLDRQINRIKQTIEPDDERQLVFEFRKEFRDVPLKFSYVDPDSGKSVSRSLIEALEKDWVQAIAQCERDREALINGNKILEPLRKVYGDLPGPQLWAKFQEDKNKRKSHKGA